MVEKRLIYYLIYTVFLFILLLFFSIERTSSKNSFGEVETEGISSITINGKALTDEYIPYLESLNNSRIISTGDEFFNLFGLDLSADEIVITYEDDSLLHILSGRTGDSLSEIYIRKVDSNKIFKVSGDFLKIIQEKPDVYREYSLIGAVPLKSVIALKIKSDTLDIHITENSNNTWIDHISGSELDRYTIQNLINKIIRLRAFSGDGNRKNHESSAFVKLETDRGEIFELFFGDISLEQVPLVDSMGNEYVIDKNKLSFLELNLKDLLKQETL